MTVGLESVHVLVEIDIRHNKRLLFINYYRSPNVTDFLPKLTGLIDQISLNSYAEVVVVLGDFNYPEIHSVTVLKFYLFYSEQSPSIC